MTTENFTINLPEKLYCGFQQRTTDNLPLAYMVPATSGSAFDKKKESITKWSNQTTYNPVSKKYETVSGLEPATFDNEPSYGFKLSKSVTRNSYWGSKNIVVRIEDPRGFELEITINNLLKLMENNIVENAEIMAECVWGCDGSNNVLLSVNSDPYIVAVANTERMNKKVGNKQVLPGMKLILQSGVTITYYGKYYLLSKLNNYASSTKFDLEKNKKHVYMEHHKDNNRNELKFTSTLNVAEIIDNKSIPSIEAELEVNNLMKLKKYRYRYIAAFFKKNNLTYELKPFNISSAEDEFTPSKLFTTINNSTYIIASSDVMSSNTKTVRKYIEVSHSALFNGEINSISKPSNKSSYNRYHSNDYARLEIADQSNLSYSYLIGKFPIGSTMYEFIVI